MKNLSKHKKWLAAGAIVILLFLPATISFAQTAPVGPTTPVAATPAPAPAATPSQTPGLFDCIKDLPTCLIYYTSLSINGALALLVDLGSWLIGWSLNLDGQVYTSTIVQTGFGVALAVANLGFVLAIIVIALATILRSETYGVKQLLWKLVVMAILVNFGLVITRPIVNFADGLTNYFVTAVGGGGGTSPWNFSTKLTGAFAPQSLLQTPITSTAGQANALGNGACNIAGLATAWLGPEFGTMCQMATAQIMKEGTGSAQIGATSDEVRATLALIFSAIVMAIIAFTLIAIGILLLVRYLYLGILLILLPLAWLTWIFPKFSNNFDKWWQEFLRWTFFPAIALFFLYLACTTVVGSTTGSSSPTNVPGLVAPAGVTPGGDLALTVGTGEPGLAQTTLDDLLLVGLCLGGLVAASSLGIKGADAAIHIGKQAGGAVTGYVAKRSKKGARYGFQHYGGQTAADRLQKSRIPGFSAIGRGLGNLTEKGGSGLVKQAAKDRNMSGLSEERLLRETQGARGNENILAYLQEVLKRGKLHKVGSVGGVGLSTWLANNQQTLENYDHLKLGRDINKNLASNDVMRTTAETINSKGENELVPDAGNLLGQGAGQMVKAGELIKAASEKFYAGMDRSDIAKMYPESMFGKEGAYGMSPGAVKIVGKAIAHGLAAQTPVHVPAMAGKMDSAEKLNNFKDYYEASVKELVQEKRLTNEQGANQIKNGIEKVLARRLYIGGGGGGGYEGGSGSSEHA